MRPLLATLMVSCYEGLATVQVTINGVHHLTARTEEGWTAVPVDPDKAESGFRLDRCIAGSSYEPTAGGPGATGWAGSGPA